MTLVDFRPRFCLVSVIAFTVSMTLGAAVSGQAQTTAATVKDERIGALIEILGKTKTPSSAEISAGWNDGGMGCPGRGRGSQIHLTDVANPRSSEGKDRWNRIERD